MEAFIGIFLQSLTEILCAFTISALGVAGTWLLNKLRKKKNLENIAIATEEVVKASQTTVKELQQTMVESWKRAQNGKLTAEQIVELREKVLEITLAKLASPVIELLEGAKVDIETMISSQAESYILEMKMGGV